MGTGPAEFARQIIFNYGFSQHNGILFVLSGQLNGPFDRR